MRDIYRRQRGTPRLDRLALASTLFLTAFVGYDLAFYKFDLGFDRNDVTAITDTAARTD